MKLCSVVWGILLLTVIVKSGQARPPSQKPASKCRDVHVWIASGAADCSYLEKESFWGIHTNPAYWCDVYKYTECCETCDRLRKNGFKIISTARTDLLANPTEIKALNVSKTVTYVWIADGSVDCKYLETESFWGLHKDPGHWCNEYVLTDCCETCTELRNQGVIG